MFMKRPVKVPSRPESVKAHWYYVGFTNPGLLQLGSAPVLQPPCC